MGDDEMAQAMRNSRMIMDEADVLLNAAPRSYRRSFTTDSMLPSTAVPSFEVSDDQQSSAAARQPPRRSSRRAASRLTPTALSSLFSDSDDDELSDADSEHSEDDAGSRIQNVRRTNVTTGSQLRTSRVIIEQTPQEVAGPDESG
ncbi:uncharacterized protein MYCFIDRAFT_210856 [Pseudocercospora fijiensis CIRAD86]|uniref:Uncharacterized protein n=1 Tax=Pseudocercospora fijiensis (strain CIRAD86) TaxID=383855 RepID=M2Z3E5_PSEFD|nr:uncharacterized protein MYCFIDRAFT_210856 [Pseudocercospora fijiensis CIRAD86]EME84350.1 hypothetical protein MYCFIDRAFT_210856 [Pseudocercospora fijiensis CIRAD86]